MSIRHSKPTQKMCWGKIDGVAPCSNKVEWKLLREGDPPEHSVYACDGHLAWALRKLGLPALVQEEEETTKRIKSVPPRGT